MGGNYLLMANVFWLIFIVGRWLCSLDADEISYLIIFSSFGALWYYDECLYRSRGTHECRIKAIWFQYGSVVWSSSPGQTILHLIHFTYVTCHCLVQRRTITVSILVVLVEHPSFHLIQVFFSYKLQQSISPVKDFKLEDSCLTAPLAECCHMLVWRSFTIKVRCP